MTQKEFDAITNHPNVLYLYPNALYAKVQNNGNHTITLLQGHSYKMKGNGFGWTDDNTRFEHDRTCKDMQFYKVNNGYQLNCYPEYSMNNSTIWNQILEK